MRIFTAVRHSIDPTRYYGGLWSANFYPALRELGCEIIESKVDLLPTSRFMHIGGDFTPEELDARARTTERILDEVRSSHRESPVHLFLSYFYNAHFDPAGFAELRRLSIPSVNFYCNSIYQFEFVADIAAGVDFAWHAERDARASYLAVGAKPIWVQMAADPKVYAPRPGAVRAPKACFVGQRYADRDRWIAALLAAKIPVEIYGPGWRRQSSPERTEERPDAGSEIYLGRPGPPPATFGSYAAEVRRVVGRDGVVRGLARIARQFQFRRQTQRLTPQFEPYARGAVSFDRQADIFSQFEVCLNFSNVWADGRPGSVLIPHVRLRDFEVPMCRSCYLTGHSDEIEEFYDIGQEIDTYRTKEELVSKVRFYLANQRAAEQLREAGYRRARRDHTWVRRFDQLFQAIGVGARS